MVLKAIETEYHGYKFRSRLEARWAVFFDAAGLKWEYEPEGFETSAGKYLPDFRVKTPQGKTIWYEVKPVDNATDERFFAFAKECGERSAVLVGDPLSVMEVSHIFPCPRCGVFDKPAYSSAIAEKHLVWGCEPCDFETPSGSNNGEEDGVCGIKTIPYKGFLHTEFDQYAMFLSQFYKAAKKARSARFEHGETPR